MTTLLASIPLSSVTADQVKQELINLIKPYFPDWTDQLDSNNMMVVLELFSMLAELNYGYLDRRAREAFIQYALDPSNILAHARGLGYTPKYQVPAEVDAILNVAPVVTQSTLIPKGSTILTIIPGISYETTTDVVVPAGSSSVSVHAAQYASQSKTFNGNGTPFQKVVLDLTPVIPDSIVLTIDGVTWTQVDSFVESSATDNHYKVLVNADGSAILLCGNGISGKVFQGNPTPALGEVTYKTGGGKAGTIGPYMMTQMSSEIHDAGNNALLTVTAMNVLASTPGVDQETPEQIRYNAIANARTSRVLLGLTDIQDATKGVPGVVVAKAVNWTIEPSLSRYMIQVFVAPTGLGVASQALLDSVMAALTVDKEMVMGTVPVVMAANYRNLTFNINLYIKTGYNFNTVSQAVHQKLLDLFDPTQTNIWNFSPEFGMSIYTSVLIAILQQVDGVRNLSITSPGDLTLFNSEFPKVIRTITLGDSGLSWDSNILNV